MKNDTDMRTFRDFNALNTVSTLSEYLIEMARDTGINTLGFNRGGDLEFYIENPKFIKKTYKDIGSTDYEVIQTDNYDFFLTNKNGEYLGHVELSAPDKNGYCSIKSSRSKIKRGFYNLLFSVILESNDIKGVLSDSELSSQAIKSYQKLANGGYHKVHVYDKMSGKIYKFSKEKLLKPSMVALVTDDQVKGTFERFYSALKDESRNPAGFYDNPIKRLYESSEEDKSYLDQFLCGSKL